MKTLSLENNEVIKAVFFILLAFISMFLVLMVFFYYSRKKIVKQTLVKKDLEIKHQKKLLQTVLFTQEEERKRIAQDLHDDISSKLNVVSLNSHLLTTPNLSEEEFAEITDNIINQTNNIMPENEEIHESESQESNDLMSMDFSNVVFEKQTTRNASWNWDDFKRRSGINCCRSRSYSRNSHI